MADIYNYDYWFTNEGDFQTDANGDLKDTSETPGRSILQEVRTRLRASSGDWPLNKKIGANLESHLGGPRSLQTIRAVSSAIINSLTFDRFLLPGEIEIIPLPIGTDVIYFRIIIHTAQGDLIDDFGYDSNSARFIGY